MSFGKCKRKSIGKPLKERQKREGYLWADNRKVYQLMSINEIIASKQR